MRRRFRIMQGQELSPIRNEPITFTRGGILELPPMPFNPDHKAGDILTIESTEGSQDESYVIVSVEHDVFENTTKLRVC